MKIPENRNIVFKVNTEAEYQYLISILKQILPESELNNFRENLNAYFERKSKYVWVYYNIMDIYKYSGIINYDDGKSVANPITRYPIMNYIILDMKNKMRNEKLKRINV